MLQCPSEELIALFLEGHLDATSAGKLTAHLAGCSACRATLHSAGDDPISGPSRDHLPRELDQVVLEVLGASEFLPGTPIGRYVISERIGAGGMGVVYLAFDSLLFRNVAVKVIHAKDRLPSVEQRNRLLREAQVLAQLSHPNVVAVHDCGTFADHVYIVMEYIDGSTLSEWLTQKQKPLSEILLRLTAAGRGLAAAHEAGIVHRDFKPQNVLLGDKGRIAVSDFGLARSTAEPPLSLAPMPATSLASSNESGLTRTGDLLGTPAYMAPEQQSGRAADARSDQFSFCLVAWEAIYGKRPGEPPAVPSGPKVARRIERVLLKGLSPDPNARYSSMNDLLRDLQGVAGHSYRSGALLMTGVLLCAIGLLAFKPPRTGGEHRSCDWARPLEGVWDPPRQESLRRAAERSRAATLWRSVEPIFEFALCPMVGDAG